jgi:hypothetical protein
MHAMVQPVLLRGLLIDPLTQGQGFLARCLVSEPGTLAGTRMFKAWNPANDANVLAYHKAMRELLSKPPTLCELGDGHELAPRVVTMSAGAEALWIEFYDEVEAQQGADKELHGARAFASKAAEHAARIAGIVEIASNPDAQELTEATMAGAIEVASFYLSEHVRLTGAGIEDRRLRFLHMLEAWIQKQGQISHKNLLQLCPHAVRVLKAKGINSILDNLVQRGYIRRIGESWEYRP